MENLLHYMWRNRLFAPCHLISVDGQEIRIVYPGIAHQDAGPDFKQAIIKVGDITWAGDVEIHVNSSDWNQHKHSEDPKYQSVILHVVYRHDVEIERTKGEYYTTLELRNYIPKDMLERYQSLTLSAKTLPCEQQIHQFSSLQFAAFFARLSTERLFRKQEKIFAIHEQCQRDWNETIYRILLENYGFRTNANAFEMLAKSLPYNILLKHHQSKIQVYALLFGQAGLLERDIEGDEYYSALQYEYNYLKYKYKLTPIQEKCWMLLRMRPHNFPTIRLAQLAEMFSQFPNFFQLITQKTDLSQFYKIFSCIPDEYWQYHFLFGKESKQHHVQMSKETINLLLINTVVPILFAYSTFSGRFEMQERALSILEHLAFEQNYITREYCKAGFPHDNASYSQAILELQKYYCVPKKCLQCNIGIEIIGKRQA